MEKDEGLCKIGRSWEQLQNTQAAQEAFERAIQVVGSWREPFLRQAKLHSGQGDFTRCAISAQAAFENHERGPFAKADENYTYLPHSLLYWNLF